MRGFLSPCVGVILLRRFVGTLIGTKIHCFTLSIQCKRLDNGLNVVRNPSKYSLKRFRHSVWRNYAFAGDVIAQTRFMSSRSPTTIRAIAALPARRRPLTHRWSDLAILRPQKTKRRDNELQFVDFRGHGSRSLWFYIYVSEYFCNYLFMAKYNLVNQGLRGPPTANYHFRHRQLTRMCPLTRSM